MAKVTIQGLDKLEKKIKQLLKDEIATKDTLEQIGELTIERIKAFARSGYSLYQGKKEKLKKLSKSYLDMRHGMIKFRTINGKKVPFNEADERLNEVDPDYFDPGKSQLTFTGQMLRALGYKAEKTQVVISVNDNKRAGKYKKLTNKQVADHVANNGRPFLGLDKLGVDRIKNILKANIRKAIINNRLNKR